MANHQAYPFQSSPMLRAFHLDMEFYHGIFDSNRERYLPLQC